jgi:Outer membrane protein beta-barrel domain
MKIQHPAFLKLPLILIFLGLNSVIGYSQEEGSCAEKLKNAQALFLKGQVEKVPSLLIECMKSGFNREESLSAYKLLIQSYLFEEKLEAADSAMLEFLKVNPEYQISPTDHSSFVNLFNDFKVKPVVEISVHIGTNFPFLTSIGRASVASEPGKSVYSSKMVNLFASVEAKFELTKKLELNFEPGYSQSAFTHVTDFMGFGKTNYTETQNRLELPVSVTYNFKRFGKFTPYGRIGFGPAFSLGATAKTTFVPTDLNGTSHTGTDIDREDSRIFMDLFAQVGAGMKFKTRGGYISAEIRSNLGILNQTVTGGASAEELRWYYYYVDDKFHLNAMNFSIGYTQIFYKPTKRKE